MLLTDLVFFPKVQFLLNALKGQKHTTRKGRSVLNGKRIFRHPKTNSFAAAVCRVEKRNCYSFSPSLLPPNCCFSKPFKLFCIRSRVVRSLKTSVRCVFVPCRMVVCFGFGMMGSSCFCLGKKCSQTSLTFYSWLLGTHSTFFCQLWQMTCRG